MGVFVREDPAFMSLVPGFGGLNEASRIKSSRSHAWGSGVHGAGVGVSPSGLMCPFLLQNMEMAPVPTKSYGNFYEGDCYVLLSVGRSGVV